MIMPRVIFFDIDDTLLSNTAAERKAASIFYTLHNDYLSGSVHDFVDREQGITVSSV